MSVEEKKKLPALLNQRQVAEELGLSLPTVARYTELGLLPPVIKARGCNKWAATDIARIKGGALVSKEAQQ